MRCADALAELQAVHVSYQQRGRDRDADVLELRRTIAQLQIGTGRHDQAAATLTDLYHDALAALGPADPLTAEIRDLLTRLAPPGR